MNSKTYKSLKVGDKVKITVDLLGYHNKSFRKNDEDMVPAGSIGIIGAIQVPSIFREGVTFACVDFPERIIGGAVQRVAARKNEMEIVS